MGYFSSHYDCRVETNKSKVFILKNQALVEWLRKKFHVQELLSSNPSTVYQMNILKSSLLYKLYSFMRKRPKIKQKESGDGPFKNKRIYAPLLCRQLNAPPPSFLWGLTDYSRPYSIDVFFFVNYFYWSSHKHNYKKYLNKDILYCTLILRT